MTVLEVALSLEESIKENERLIHHVAKKFRQRASIFMIEYEDLISEGTIGLIKAIQNFKPEYGFKFATYAVPMIEGQLRRVLRDANPGPKFCRAAKDLAYKIDGSESVEEIVDKFNVKKHLAEEALVFKGKARAISIDTPIGSNDGKELTIGDLIVSSEDFSSVEVDDFTQTLEPKYKTVLTLAMKDKTQQEIADKVGCSQVQVSRTLGKIKRKYEEYLKGGNKKMPIITVDEYKKFKEEGLTDTQIAIQKNTSPNYLSQLKKKWNVSSPQAPADEKKPFKGKSIKEDKTAEYEALIKELKAQLSNSELGNTIRANDIKKLKTEMQEIVERFTNAEKEKGRLLDENNLLINENHKLDTVIENQKYQLEKWAKENDDLQEENTALKVFARRYLAVV